MIERIQGGTPSSYNPISTDAATLHKMRVAYNMNTKTFGPIGAGDTKKIDHMVEVEQGIAGMRVPTDYTSQIYLTSVATKNDFKGTKIETGTEQVGAFLSGDQRYYSNFIASISSINF